MESVVEPPGSSGGEPDKVRFEGGGSSTVLQKGVQSTWQAIIPSNNLSRVGLSRGKTS